MPGAFCFRLRSRIHFDLDRWTAALRECRKYKPPKEVYASYGPEDLGIGLVIKLQKRNDWHLILPTDPLNKDIECGLTHGIVSRPHIWEYVRTVLTHLCSACPLAFEFSYEDRMDDVSEVGYFDHRTCSFIVRHQGLPSPEDLERASCMVAAQQVQRSAQYLQVVRQLSL